MKNSILNDIEPWNISTEERIAELLTAKRNGRKIAIILYPEEDKASSFRYRGYNIYQATKKSTKWQAIYFFLNEIDTVFELLPQANLLIFGRITRWSPQLDELAVLARNNKVSILQDLDDCICGTKYIKDMFNVVSPDFIDQEYWITTCAHYELISYLADGFIVTNSYLGNLLSTSHGHKPYKVIKNFLNEEQIDLSEKILKENKVATGFTIGYFSGSHTHLTDFEVVYQELINVLTADPAIRLMIVGMLDLPASASKFIKTGQITFHPLVDFLTLEQMQAAVDLNIAPLADNVFANCKSDLKFFEPALVKTPTIASPTFTFAQAIENGKTGYLCEPGEWQRTIMMLRNDSRLRKEIGENAHRYVLKNYSPENNIKEIEECYDYYNQK